MANHLHAQCTNRTAIATKMIQVGTREVPTCSSSGERKTSISTTACPPPVAEADSDQPPSLSRLLARRGGVPTRFLHPLSDSLDHSAPRPRPGDILPVAHSSLTILFSLTANSGCTPSPAFRIFPSWVSAMSMGNESADDRPFAMLDASWGEDMEGVVIVARVKAASALETRVTMCAMQRSNNDRCGSEKEYVQQEVRNCSSQHQEERHARSKTVERKQRTGIS